MMKLLDVRAAGESERLAMKTPSNVSQRVRNFENTSRKKLAFELQKWREINEI
jgi:hypothetical protein